MTALAKEDNTPRWKQDQIEERLREREDAGAKLGEDSLTEVESGCIDALLQESEARGLRQRRDWAKRQCVREKVERTSRSALDQGASRTSGSGGQAEMAELDLSGRELTFPKSPQLSSQCNGRVETHWKPSKLQGGMQEGREMDTCGANLTMVMTSGFSLTQAVVRSPMTRRTARRQVGDWPLSRAA